MVEIGYTLKTHGYKGDLKIRYNEAYAGGMEELNALFLQINGEHLPYFITSFHHTTGTEAIIHLEGVDSKEEAALLKGKTLFARASDLPEPSLEEAPVSEFIGLSVSDVHLGVLGEVEDVYEMPEQSLLVVNHKGKELLIPMHPDLVTEYTPENRSITFELPEGFLDL